jgi:biotin operon repressor
LTEAQIDELVGILRKGIEAAMQDLKKEGLLKA